MNKLITALGVSLLAGGCVVRSPLLDTRQRFVERQAPQPVVIQQPAIQQQLPIVQRWPVAQQVQPQPQAIGFELTEDELIDQKRMLILTELANEIQSTPFQSLMMRQVKQMHDIEVERNAILAKYANYDRPTDFLNVGWQDEPATNGALNQSEINYLRLGDIQ